jgi:hypothetical protein
MLPAELSASNRRADDRLFIPRISLGNVLTILAIVGSVWIAYGRLAERLGALDTKVDAMWSAFLKHVN